MICFSLVCTAGHGFDGWFKSNAGYEDQLAAGQVACPTCGTAQVRKAVMAPAVVTRARGEAPAPAPVPAQSAPPADEATRRAAMRQFVKQMHEHVRANFDHVGDRFAAEARRIHYGEADRRHIWGQATASEARELHEEGIAVAPLPDLPKLDG